MSLEFDIVFDIDIDIEFVIDIDIEFAIAIAFKKKVLDTFFRIVPKGLLLKNTRTDGLFNDEF